MRLLQLAKHRLVKDSLILFGVQVSGYALPLLTLPYLTRVLGPENFGLTALGTALILYFYILVDYGFGVTGPRQVAMGQNDPQRVARIYGTILSCKLGLLALSLIILIGVLLIFSQYRAHWVLYALSFLQVVGWALTPTWLLQGLQRMRYIAVADYGSKIISVALIFLLVRKKSDYLLAAGLQAGGFVVAGCIGTGIVVIGLGIRPIWPGWEEVRAAMKEAWPVFLSLASISVVSSTNTVILNSVASVTAVGFLSAASRLIVAARALTNPITAAVYPHMSKLAAESPRRGIEFLRKQLVWTSLPFLAISVGMLVMAPLAVKILYGAAYAETGVLLRIMSSVPFVHSLGMCFGNYYMLAFGFEKEWSSIIKRMTVLNFVILPLLMLLIAPVRAVALTSTLLDVYAAGSCMLFYRRTSGTVLAQAREEGAALG